MLNQRLNKSWDSSELIFELAQNDGWFALYNPSDSTTARYDDMGRLQSLQDSLKNLPDLIPKDPSLPPLRNEKSFGRLDGLLFGANLSPTALIHQQKVTDITHDSLFIMTVSKYPSDLANRNQFLYDGIAPNSRTSLLLTGSDDIPAWAAYSGMQRTIHAPEIGDEPTVVGVQFSGSASGQTIINNAEYFTPRLRKPSHDYSFQGLTIGERYIPKDESYWAGEVGLIAIYLGVPTQNVKERMRRLLISQVKTNGYQLCSLTSENSLRIAEDGTRLHDHNADELQIPASIIKLLTTYFARKFIWQIALLSSASPSNA